MPQLSSTRMITVASYVLIVASVGAFLLGGITQGSSIRFSFGLALAALVAAGAGVLIAPTSASRSGPGTAFITALIVSVAFVAFLFHLHSELRNFENQ